jgi:hypothetical protein
LTEPTTGELLDRANTILGLMRCLAEGGTANLDSSGGHTKPGSRAPAGAFSRQPASLHDEHRQAILRCRTTDSWRRRALWAAVCEAERDFAAFRGMRFTWRRGRMVLVPRPPEREIREHRDLRILRDHAGTHAYEVATYEGVAQRDVELLRRRTGLDPMWGAGQ